MQFNVTQCVVVGMQLKGQLQKVCHLLSRPKVEKLTGSITILIVYQSYSNPVLQQVSHTLPISLINDKLSEQKFGSCHVNT